MKKRILGVFLILIAFLFSPCECLADWHYDSLSFLCDATTNLTKNIYIKAHDDSYTEVLTGINVEWGDDTVSNISCEENKDAEGIVKLTHTYASTGKYKIEVKSPYITYLDVSSNDIIEIDLSNALGLSELNISENRLEYLDVSNCNLLDRLNCRSNYLSAINVTQSNISMLECSDNNLTFLAVPETIQKLYVNNNELEATSNLSNFNLSGFSDLSILECSGNKISTLTLEGCNSLITLNCEDNFINEMLLTDCVLLEELYCDENEISTLDLSANSKLQILECNKNNMESLNISNNTNLTELYCYDNSISDLDLNNINLTFAVVDNTVNVTNSNAVTLIKIKTEGEGTIYLRSDKNIMFSNIPETFLVNGVQQENVLTDFDVSEYKGTYDIVISFNNIENQKQNVNAPELSDGMIPVKYNGTNWVITNKFDDEWYSYDKENKKWANVMLRESAYYLDLDGKTLKSVGNTSLDELIGREVPESNTGSMYVWIPRFSYKINDSGIDIKFSSGLEDYIEEDYKAHPAFNYANYKGGDTSSETSYNVLGKSNKRLGIWVAKYQAGGDISQPEYTSSATKINNASIGNAFSASLLTSSLTGMEKSISHMMKNTEWGAVAYFVTSMDDMVSTTGNIYGIFDMDTDAEYVSNFVELVGGVSNFSVRKNGLSLVPYKMMTYSNNEVSKIEDIDILKLTSTIDNEESNSIVLNNFYGIGIGEVNSNITGTISKKVPNGKEAFFIRGIDGIYSYSGTTGESNSNIGFRNVIFVESTTENTSNYYTITASSQGNGVISPSGNTTVEEGKNLTYSIIPNTGNELIDVTVDGISVYYDIVNYGTYYTYKFDAVDSNHKILAVFDSEINSYEVSVIKNPEDVGQITGEGAYKNRSEVTLKANGTNGYKFSSWETVENLDEEIDTLVDEITFKMPAKNVLLKANFEKVLKAILTVENMYGRMFFEKNVDEGVAITAEEIKGYVFKKWISTGLELTPEQINSRHIEITIPGNDVSLVAKYNRLYPLVLIDNNTILQIEQEEGETVNFVAAEGSNGYETYGLEETLDSTSNISFVMPSNGVSILVREAPLYHLQILLDNATTLQIEKAKGETVNFATSIAGFSGYETSGLEETLGSTSNASFVMPNNDVSIVVKYVAPSN